jgi:SnoaL-like domain
MTRGRRRSTRDVLEDHLRLRRRGAGKVEEDITRNYAEDVVLLTGFGVFRGHDGVRRSAQILHEQLPCARYQYLTRLVDGEMAFLEWAARCPTARVEDGADSYLIRDGRIVAQTIHYTVRRLQQPEGPERRRASSARPKRRNT